MINIPKADWFSVKNKQLTATPCYILVGDKKQAFSYNITVKIIGQVMEPR